MLLPTMNLGVSQCGERMVEMPELLWYLTVA
jgi:hypothetical protein